ncbi:MAG: P-II family nitrogen regulator [Peptococcaceae bacterium]|nr:P-II family nitrogen regulator [Peptococcaceae bacterium]
MLRIEYMITIVGRAIAESCISYFKSEGVHLNLKTRGKGTAKDEMINYLGLGDSEKVVLFSTMNRAKSKKVLEYLSHNLKKPGTGIAFTIPIDAVCGLSSLGYLGGISMTEEEHVKMESSKVKHELIMVIVNRGHVNTVMNAAHEAGVSGGTALHAVGMGSENKDEKFFGISIGTEKDVVMIVVESGMKQNVMKAILAEAGRNPKTNCVLFSMPVSDVVGIGGVRT